MRQGSSALVTGLKEHLPSAVKWEMEMEMEMDEGDVH